MLYYYIQEGIFMQKTSKYRLSDRAQLTCLTTTQFKTSVISAGYALPLENENAATAILPYLLRQGTAEYPDMNALSMYLDELYGAQIEPYVRKIGDRIVVGFVAEAIDESVLPEAAAVTENVIRLLGKMLHEPAFIDGKFNADTLELEKKNLLNRIRGLKNDTRSYAQRRAKELLHANDAFGYSEFGTEAGVAALTEQSVHDAFDYLMNKGELELFYCGTLQGDEAAELFRGAMPVPTGSAFGAVNTPYYNKEVSAETIVEEMNVTQGKMTLCLTSPYTGMSAEYPALLLFTEILGGYTGSRLFCNVREKMSLCYYASAGLAFTTGEVLIASGIENSKFEVARDAVLEQLNDLCSGGMTEEEVEQARRTKINALRSMQDSALSMESYWQARMMCGVEEGVDDLIARLEALTLKEVVAAGKTLRVALIYFLKGVGA